MAEVLYRGPHAVFREALHADGHPDDTVRAVRDEEEGGRVLHVGPYAPAVLG